MTQQPQPISTCPCCDPITGNGLTGRCTCGGTEIDHNMLRARLDIEPIRARHAYGDEEFIQHAEDDVAALLAEIDRLRAELHIAQQENRRLFIDGEAKRGTTDRLRAELQQAKQLHAEVHLYDHAEGCPHPEPDDDQPEQGDAWAARHPYGMDGEGYTADRICLDLPWGQSVCATCIDPDHAPRLHVWPCPTAAALGAAPAAVSGA